MQEIINAFLPPATLGSGMMLALIWVPAIVFATAMMCWFQRSRDKFPRDMMLLAKGAFLSMGTLALTGAWQSFQHFSIKSWAILTGAQLAVTLVFILLARLSSKGVAAGTAEHFATEWKRKAKVLVIALPLAGLLLTIGSTRHFVLYMMGTPATATVVSQTARVINAEWQAPDDKKIPVVLVFDNMHAFRPAVKAGDGLPIRVNAAEITAGKASPVYIVDMGLVPVLLGGLSTLIFGLAALGAGLLLRKKA